MSLKTLAVIGLGIVSQSNCMERDVPLWSTEQKICSSAAQYAYKMTKEDQAVDGFNILNQRFQDEQSIQAVTLYNPETNVGVISYRGTVTPQDWQANLGIGCSIARAIHHDNLTDKDGYVVRVPSYFSDLATTKLNNLLGEDLPLALQHDEISQVVKYFGSSFLDAGVSGSYLLGIGKDAVADFGKGLAATVTGTLSGAGIGTVVPIMGTLAGAGAGTVFGASYGIIKGLSNTGSKLYNITSCLWDKNKEREIHIESMEKLIQLDTFKTYTSDAVTFAKSSVEKIMSESDGESRPTIYVTGHSLGRFLAGTAFLDYLGGANQSETSIALDGLSGFQNVGFNGPAGFQGMAYLPGIENQKILSALKIIESNQESFIHIRRHNDLVGSLGTELDKARGILIPDVARASDDTSSKLFLRNHGIAEITEELQK